MNKMTKLAAAIALASGALATAPAMAEVEMSANAGFVSEYYFRGIELGDAGAYGGFDVSMGGFYAGTWIIDDGGNEGGEDGLETDFYVGYGFEFENGLWVDLAYNMYEYTYTSDSEAEFMFTAGYDAFSLEYTVGEGDYDEEDDFDDEGFATEETEYTYMALSWSGEVFGITVGAFEDETDDTDYESEYKHVDLTASGEIAGLDVTLTLGKTFDVDEDEIDDPSDDDSGDGYFFIDVSKSFDL